MINQLIYVECNPDELLVILYGFSKKNINHSYGKSRIGKLLERNQGQVALVDEDPDGTPIPYFNKTNFSLIKQTNGYRIINDSRRSHMIVEIQPSLEVWILDACDDAKIDIREYNLPKDPISLHHIINSNLKRLEKLLKELLNHNCRVKELRDDFYTIS